MSSHVVVIASPTRRASIKVSPGTHLIDVLDEACAKLSLNSENYLLRHKEKPLDLSASLRLLGLPPGAKLELVQKTNPPSELEVVVQMPQSEAKGIPSARLQRTFPAHRTLWQVLREFEDVCAQTGSTLNITARGVAGGLEHGRGSGQLYYETPVLHIMGRELSTFADFQKTLPQLGHNSKGVMIRLSYRTTQQTLSEAMEHINQFSKADQQQQGKANDSTAETKIGAGATAQPGDTVMANATPAPPQTSSEAPPKAPTQQPPTASATQQASEEAVPAGEPAPSRDPYQPLNVFLAPTGSAPAATLAPADEEDFAPTIAHAQLHQALLLKSSRNQRLPSDKELEDKAAAEAARIAAIKSVLVKVRFPDNTSSDWQVGPQETGAFLHEAVRQVMANRDHAFRLVLPGNKKIIHDADGPGHGLIRDYKLSGRVLVSLIWDDSVPPAARKKPFLKQSVAQTGQAVRVPELPTAQDDGETAPPTQPQPARAGRGVETADGAAKKMPKWFKFGKK